jgi:hypothetical protein
MQIDVRVAVPFPSTVIPLVEKFAFNLGLKKTLSSRLNNKHIIKIPVKINRT